MKADDVTLGDPNNKIWIISSCPKRGDTGLPLSSSVGRSFVNVLVNCGVSLHDVHFDYLVNKVPPMGKMKNGIGHFKETGRLEEDLSLLKAKIQTYKPNLIFGLGSDVLYWLAGKSPILKWRGHAIWSDELGCKIMCTFDPYAAHTQKRLPKEQKPGQYETLMHADISKAAQEMKTPAMLHEDPELVVAPSYEQAMDIMGDMLNGSQVISYDVEVFKPYEGRLLDCIGLADNINSGLCIPFYLQNDDNSILRYFKDEEEYTRVWARIRELMASNIPKVAQNSSFDTTMLEYYYNCPVNNLVWDTMVFQHCLYCDLPKDLGTLISLYTNLPYHKFMIHDSGSVNRWQYNAADAVANLCVMQGQIREVFEIEEQQPPALQPNQGIPSEVLDFPVVQHYYKVCNPAIHSCNQMHMAGVKVDMNLRDQVIALETGYMEQLQDAIDLALPIRFHTNKRAVHNFNPKSPTQKAMLFYDVFKCKMVKNRGKVTTDKNAVKKFKEDERDYVSTMAEACLEVKAADARLLKFKVEPDEGRLRTKYDVTGTDTGRLASGENRETSAEGKVIKNPVIPAETNLQNVEKGPQRQMFIPDEADQEFAMVDLYAAEAYLNALDAGELDMLKMISGLEETDVKHEYGVRIMDSKTAEKYKIHNWMQDQTAAAWEAECEKHNYTYKLAKQTIHGLNYNVQPPKMTLESGLPISVTSWQYSMYHTKFPGIKARMARINNQLKRMGFMCSPLGRRRFFFMDYGVELQNIAYAWPSQSTIGEVTICAQNYLHYISDMHEAGFGVPYCRPALNTHDGLAIKMKKGTRQEVIPYILNAFRIPMELHNITIIIPVSIGWGNNFNENKGEEVYFYPLDLEQQCP